FFQAEDGIRDFHVTGVQTCALPIFTLSFSSLVIFGLITISESSYISGIKGNLSASKLLKNKRTSSGVTFTLSIISCCFAEANLLSLIIVESEVFKSSTLLRL